MKSSEYKIFETEADLRKDNGGLIFYKVTKNH